MPARCPYSRTPGGVDASRDALHHRAAQQRGALLRAGSPTGKCGRGCTRAGIRYGLKNGTKERIRTQSASITLIAAKDPQVADHADDDHRAGHRLDLLLAARRRAERRIHRGVQGEAAQEEGAEDHQHQRRERLERPVVGGLATQQELRQRAPWNSRPAMAATTITTYCVRPAAPVAEHLAGEQLTRRGGP